MVSTRSNARETLKWLSFPRGVLCLVFVFVTGFSRYTNLKFSNDDELILATITLEIVFFSSLNILFSHPSLMFKLAESNYIRSWT